LITSVLNRVSASGNLSWAFQSWELHHRYVISKPEGFSLHYKDICSRSKEQESQYVKFEQCTPIVCHRHH
jgi:hypothetical protein